LRIQSFDLQNTITIRRGTQLPVIIRRYISVAQQQKTANFKVAFDSRLMQWSAITEEKQKNQLTA
jgi:hypothetical protein